MYNTKTKEGKIMKKALVLFAVAMFATGIVTAAEVKKDAAKDAKSECTCKADTAKKDCKCKTPCKCQEVKKDTKEVKK